MWVFQKIRQFFGDLKLQSKFILFLILAVSVPMLIMGFFLLGSLDNMTASYTLNEIRQSSTTAIPRIGNILNEVVETSDSLSKQPFYSQLFGQFNSNISEDTLVSSLSAADFKKKTDSVIDGSLITAVRIYVDFPSDGLLFSSENTGSIFFPVNQLSGAYWYGLFVDSSQASLFCPSSYLGEEEQKNCGDLAYIYRDSLYYQGEQHNAYIAVYYSSQKITEILTETISLKGTAVYLVDQRNNPVVSSDETLTETYWLDYDTLENSFMYSNSLIERTIQDQKIYASFYRVNQPSWFLVVLLPDSLVRSQSNQILLQFIFFYILGLFIMIIFASFAAHSVTARLSSVISQMMQVRHNLPVLMDSPKYHDEVGDLIDTYNYMTRRMNILIENQKKAEEELRISEFNSLQAQINPHFLYNTMDMINWQAQQGKTDEVSEAVQSLSRFYKLTLSRKESISTIAREEEHISIYLRLQNMRYHDRIAFVSDIPDELLDYGIPKLTLQPVVENAVLHGILEKEDKSGTIVLTGWMEDDDIVLLVSDDGVGIPPEKLKTILTGQGKSASGGTNIAVYNTHRRLQLLYGEKYGLHYSSEYGKGTDVEIRLPAGKTKPLRR